MRGSSPEGSSNDGLPNTAASSPLTRVAMYVSPQPDSPIAGP